MLEDRGQAYILAVRSNHSVRFGEKGTLVHTDPLTMAEGLAAKAWVMHPAGEGIKGLRCYEWARLSRGKATPGWESWVLVRRSL
jgi:hypothetical protein